MDSTSTKKTNHISIYILIACIAFLLGSNAYLYFKFKSENKQTVEKLNSEKQVLALEIQQLEKRLRASKVVSDKLENLLGDEREHAEAVIRELKEKFKKGTLTSAELKASKEEIIKLRQFLDKYQNAVDSLQKANEILSSKLNKTDKQIKILNNQNSELNNKIRQNIDFQVQAMDVIAYKVKSNGKKVKVTKANTTQEFEISFNILPNNLIESKKYPVYLRIFDPTGNLITTESGSFLFKNEQLQYTLMTNIDYQDFQSGDYKLQWRSSSKFQSGTYTVLLYGLNHIIAEKKIDLR